MQTSSFLLVTICGVLVFGGAGTSASRVPVLLWAQDDVGGAGAHPLQHTTVDEWEHLARKQIKAHALTVVFVEETLSPEDLSAKDEQGRSAFEGLRARAQRGGLLHLPAVPSAVSVLKDVADPDQVNRVRLTDEGLSADVHSATGKFLFIELDDAKEGEDRFRMLARHDAFINQMFDKLLDKHPSVLAVYAARYPSWEIPSERLRRDAGRHLMQQTESISGFYNASDKFYLYSTVMSYTKEGTTKFFELTDNPDIVNTDDQMEITWKTNDSISLKFNLTNDKGYWSLRNVDFDSQSTSMKDIYAPGGFSYSCRHLNANFDNSSMTMKPFQIQAFFGLIAQGKFDSSYDCVGTMSTPIWSGLLIVFLLLFISICGIMMMMDIRTMDRFDDPKGKTITINASE